MNFGQAIEALKEGKKVAREGWNGKGMMLYINYGSKEIPANENELVEGIKSSLFVQGDKDTITRLPNINMRAATGSTVTGWLASQTDMLSEDWIIVE